MSFFFGKNLLEEKMMTYLERGGGSNYDLIRTYGKRRVKILFSLMTSFMNSSMFYEKYETRR